MLQGVSNSLQPNKNDTPAAGIFRKTMLRSYTHYTTKYKFFESDLLKAITFLDPGFVFIFKNKKFDRTLF